MLDDAAVQTVVTQKHLRHHFEGYHGRVCAVEELSESAADGSEGISRVNSPGSAGLYHLHVGFDGHPKGVAVTHGSLVHHSMPDCSTTRIRSPDSC